MDAVSAKRPREEEEGAEDGRREAPPATAAQPQPPPDVAPAQAETDAEATLPQPDAAATPSGDAAAVAAAAPPPQQPDAAPGPAPAEAAQAPPPPVAAPQPAGEAAAAPPAAAAASPPPAASPPQPCAAPPPAPAASPAAAAAAAGAAGPSPRPPGAGAPGRPDKKRKACLLLAYVGAGFSGMQHNPGVATVESCLLGALVACGAVPPVNADFGKLTWSRAARTDKGVSAMGQAVAAKLLLGGADGDGGDGGGCGPAGAAAAFLGRLNARLPASVRALGVARTTGGFNAKEACDRRRYRYLLPASALDPLWPPQQPAAAAAAAAAAGAAGGGEAAAAAEQPAAAAGASCFDAAAAMAALAALLCQYEGTHCFARFTPRLAPSDPSARRYILACGATLLPAADGPRPPGGGDGAAGPPPPPSPSGGPSLWVCVEVLGQSFLMHQIRCMVGAAVAAARGDRPPGSVRDALLPPPAPPRAGGRAAAAAAAAADAAPPQQQQQPPRPPLAPALGLYLCETVFESYNARWDGTHPKLGLACDGAARAAAAAFERDRVWDHIVTTDARDAVFATWCAGLRAAPTAAAGSSGGGGGATAKGGDEGGEEEAAGPADDA